MAAPISAPRYSIDDLERLPDDGNRYELLDGILLVTPAPSVRHQSIATELAFQIRRGLSPDVGRVHSPGAIPSGSKTQLQPDILVVPASREVITRWEDMSAHWLAIEILSRSSRVYDRDIKRNACFELGVHEVWIVDPVAMCVEVARTTGQIETMSDSIRWHVAVAGSIIPIDLQEVFRNAR